VTRGQGRSEISAPQPLNSASALSLTRRRIRCPPRCSLRRGRICLRSVAPVSTPRQIRSTDRGERRADECQPPLHPRRGRSDHAARSGRSRTVMGRVASSPVPTALPIRDRRSPVRCSWP
jgi:hypothetical protein